MKLKPAELHLHHLAYNRAGTGWRVDLGHAASVRIESGDELGGDTKKAIALRLAVCWNVLEGIPTDALLDGSVRLAFQVARECCEGTHGQAKAVERRRAAARHHHRAARVRKRCRAPQTPRWRQSSTPPGARRTGWGGQTTKTTTIGERPDRVVRDRAAGRQPPNNEGWGPYSWSWSMTKGMIEPDRGRLVPLHLVVATAIAPSTSGAHSLLRDGPLDRPVEAVAVHVGGGDEIEGAKKKAWPALSKLARTFRAADKALANVGQSGSGKTYAAMRLAELMLEAGAQVVSLDPMGVWWGLLSAANGNASGYPVHVFGGAHAHVPIVPEAGALVAEVLVEKQISAVIDLSHFTRSETVQFAIAFAERFFKLQVQVKRPVHVFFEEAQTFMPQNLPRGDSGGDPRKNPAVMLNRVELLVRQGRSQGVGCSMITQAPQAVAKSCLNQAGTLFAMRTMGKHERKAIGDWMADKATDDSQLKLDQQLPKLNTGEAWVASPNFLGIYQHTKVSKKTTFDSSATPKFGVRLEAPKVLADVDVEALRESMKTVVETIEKDDPAPLRRRIAQLERELAVNEKHMPPPAPQIVEVPVFDEKQRAALIEVEHQVLALNRTVRDLVAVAQEAGAMSARTRVKNSNGITLNVPAAWAAQIAAAPKTVVKANGHAPKLEGTGLKKGAREMLRELAALHPRSLTRRELATRVVMSHSGGSVGDYISALVTAGLVEKDDAGDYRATAEGKKAAGGVTAKSSGEIVALWKNTSDFKRGVREMLDTLLSQPGEWLTREQLAEAAGMESSGGSTGDYISALVAAGCADAKQPRGGPYTAGHALFLGGQ